MRFGLKWWIMAQKASPSWKKRGMTIRIVFLTHTINIIQDITIAWQPSDIMMIDDRPMKPPSMQSRRLWWQHWGSRQLLQLWQDHYYHQFDHCHECHYRHHGEHHHDHHAHPPGGGHVGDGDTRVVRGNPLAPDLKSANSSAFNRHLRFLDLLDLHKLYFGELGWTFDLLTLHFTEFRVISGDDDHYH